MLNTTLCYIENNDAYLMLLRNKKENDLNSGKWIGVGGKFEENESPDECLLREVKEETGLLLTSYRFRGVVTFVSDKWECEQMFLYTAHEYSGELKECSEGTLCWIRKKDVPSLDLWEGDRVFLEMLDSRQEPFFIKLVYEGDNLIDVC